MRECFDLCPGGGRFIREKGIEAMRCELAEEVVELAFVAGQLDWWIL